MAATLPISAKELIRFTPPRAEGESAPTYLIAPAKSWERTRWRRDVDSRGARYVDQREIEAQLNVGIERLLAGDERAAALADAELVTTTLDKFSRGEEVSVPEEFVAANTRVIKIEAMVFRDDPPYARLIADRNFYREVSSEMMVRHFVRGWDALAERCPACEDTPAADPGAESPPTTCERCKGERTVSVKFRAENGVMTEDCFEQVPPRDLLPLALKITDVVFLNARQQKN